MATADVQAMDAGGTPQTFIVAEHDNENTA